MENTPADSDIILQDDILFECPHCGKSLAIAAAGRGLIVTCTDCGKHVQVPFGPTDPAIPPLDEIPGVLAEQAETIRQLDEGLARAAETINQLAAAKESHEERIAFLEALRKQNTERIARAAGELELMRNAMDRALKYLADARTEKPE